MKRTKRTHAAALVAVALAAVALGTGAASASAAAGGSGGPSGAGGAASGTTSGASADHSIKPAANARPHGLRPPSRHGQAAEATLPAADTLSTAYMYNQKNGAIQTDPHIYLVYWGDWSGDNLGVMNRLWNFYRGLGGAPMGSVLSQSQQGCTAGTWNCTGAHAGNTSAPFKSYWKDTSYVPATPTQAEVAAEAR